MICRVLCAALGAILLSASVARAHDVAVTGIVRVLVTELPEHRYVLSVLDAGAPPIPDAPQVLPAFCRRTERERTSSPATSLPRVPFRCDRALTADEQIQLPWKLSGVVAVAAWRDGTTASAFFRGDGNAITLRLGDVRAAAGSRTALMSQYFVLGIEHILSGVDHLLFVFGLLLLVRGAGALVKTITAFTAAHSVTLGAAALGFVSVNSGAVEATIALSIVLLAREIVSGARGARHLVHRRPWLVAGAFGLLHGFGFAGALGDIGLRAADIPLALLFFNLGVEAGQLLFVSALVALYAMARGAGRVALSKYEPALGYTLGILSTFWFFDRLFLLDGL